MKTRSINVVFTNVGVTDSDGGSVATPYQWKLHPAVADSLPSPFPSVACKSVFPVAAGDLTTTTQVCGTNIFELVSKKDSYTYNAPASDEAGISETAQANMVVRAPSVKILQLQGNNQNNISADIFLQLWTFPVASGDSWETGTLVNDDTNTGATCLFCRRILDNYSFSVELTDGLELSNCVLAFSQHDTDDSKPFYITDLSSPITCNVTIEDVTHAQ